MLQSMPSSCSISQARMPSHVLAIWRYSGLVVGRAAGGGDAVV